MTFEKGWINRQFAQIEKDAEKWPNWMRREADWRAAASKTASNASSCTSEAANENKSGDPPTASTLKAGG
jgi:hypothetical protein